MAKRFITPFAEAGDRTTMPDGPVGTDSNYQTGYTAQYEEDPVVNPSTAKFVERDKSNQLYNDITANIKEWQEHVYPAFITSAVNGGVPFAYKKNSIVNYLGVDYASNVDGNEDVPPSSKWDIFSTSLIKVVINYDTVIAAVNDPSLKVNQQLSIMGRNTKGDTGATTWYVVSVSSVVPNTSTIVSHATLPLAIVYSPNTFVDALACGVVSAVESSVFIQEAQNLSELLMIPVDFSGVTQISFNGIITFQGYLEWHGAGRFDTTVKPLELTRTAISAENWIQKRDETIATDHFLIQDMGFDGSYTSGGFPALDNLISMIRHKPDGCTDKDITYLRCHFKDIPHECAVHSPKVTALVSSGGKIDNVNMLFCSGDVTSLAGASRSSNMFKTINGSIDDPGEYLNYPITNVISFGNTCRGMRSLADYKRGTRHFSHNESTVIDMTDVASISVDGVKDGTIGPNNTGYQTSAAVDSKNIYEIQGIDVDVLGGKWNANNEVNAVAAVLVTDYIYPAETTSSWTGNQSQRVNITGFNAENITGHAVRLINTSECSVTGVRATNCDLDAVSFEYQAGKFTKDGSPLLPSGNSVDDVRINQCRYAASSNSNVNIVKAGPDLYDEFDQYSVETPANFLFTFSEVNLNKNELVTDYTGGTTPLFWSGAATYTVGGKALSSPSSFVLEDSNTGALHYLTYNANIELTVNQKLYFTLSAKSGTATSRSILVQQYDSSDVFVSSTFISVNTTSEWVRYKKLFTADQANCAYVIVSLLPAGDYSGAGSETGTTEFADVRIGRRPSNQS